jgi:hypothetical protein
MKKQLIALALFAAGCSVASAQSEIFYNPDNKAYFGVRASLDITCPGDVNIKGVGSFSDYVGNGVGFSVGAIYNVPVYYNLYFEPGLNIYRHNAKSKDWLVDMASKLHSTEYSKVTLSEWGFDIPLVFGYHFDFSDIKLSVFTGPEFRVGLSGKTKYTTTKSVGPKLKGSESMYSDESTFVFNRADVAWRFGVGVTYQKYYFSISGAPGLCNWLNDATSDVFGEEKISMHRNTVSFTLGYNF